MKTKVNPTRIVGSAARIRSNLFSVICVAIFMMVALASPTLVMGATSDTPEPPTIIIFTVGSNTFSVNGLSSDITVTPFIQGNRVRVPVREFGEALGATVSVDSTTGNFILQREDRMVNIAPNDSASGSLMRDGHMVVATDFLELASRVLGFNAIVDWNAGTNTVTITASPMPRVGIIQVNENVEIGEVSPEIRAMWEALRAESLAEMTAGLDDVVFVAPGTLDDLFGWTPEMANELMLGLEGFGFLDPSEIGYIVQIITGGNVTTTPTPTQVATSGQTTTIILTIGSTAYTVNGVGFQADSAPFLAGGRTMVPLRLVSEALGAEVGWNGDTQTVTISSSHSAPFSLTIGVPLPNDMGVAIMQGGRTFVPLRYVAEMLNAEIDWNGATQTITIVGNAPAVSAPVTTNTSTPIPQIFENHPNRFLTPAEVADWQLGYNLAGGANTEELEVLRLINRERAAHGQRPITADSNMMMLARYFTQHLVLHGDIPDGYTDSSSGWSVGYNNLFVQRSRRSAAETVVEAWLENNMLRHYFVTHPTPYDGIGIGFVDDRWVIIVAWRVYGNERIINPPKPKHCRYSGDCGKGTHGL